MYQLMINYEINLHFIVSWVAILDMKIHKSGKVMSPELSRLNPKFAFGMSRKSGFRPLPSKRPQLYS